MITPPAALAEPVAAGTPVTASAAAAPPHDLFAALLALLNALPMPAPQSRLPREPVSELPAAADDEAKLALAASASAAAAAASDARLAAAAQPPSDASHGPALRELPSAAALPPLPASAVQPAPARAAAAAPASGEEAPPPSRAPSDPGAAAPPVLPSVTSNAPWAAAEAETSRAASSQHTRSERSAQAANPALARGLELTAPSPPGELPAPAWSMPRGVRPDAGHELSSADAPRPAAARSALHLGPLSFEPAAEPAAPSTPSAPSAAPATESARPVASHALWLAERGGGRARIALSPPELGGVEIVVRVRGRRVEVQLRVEEAAALQVARDARQQLADALAARDLRMEEFSVDAGGARSDGGGANDTRREDAPVREQPPAPGDELRTPARSPAARATPVHAPRPERGAIDLRV